MDVKGIAKEPVVATVQSFGKRLNHCPSRGVVE
jgi:hypothetical protein